MSKESVVITSLPEMEEIVASNRYLEWSGWDVLHYGKTTTFINPKAVKKGRRWTVRNRYTIESNGWTIPSDIG